MSWFYRERRPSVRERRAAAKTKLDKVRKSGRTPKPVEIFGRTIATTFWGKSWCQNLESFSDYANRLPRGRTYARNGSILDLHITAGRIDAVVSGSRIYEVTLSIGPVSDERWQSIREECTGQIDSLVELLQGHLSARVMDVVTRGGGLLPTSQEIELRCSCPDWAVMCKHVAATLYGVGARLDHQPEMLFSLRGVDPSDLIAGAIGLGVSRDRPVRGRVLEVVDLSAVFGVDIDFDFQFAPNPSPDGLSERAESADNFIELEPPEPS